MKKIDYDEIIRRFSYFRNKANFSGRELSERLDYNPQFVKTIERKEVELKVSTLLNFCEIMEITPQEFFYLGDKYNKNDAELLEIISSLSFDEKEAILKVIKLMK